MLNNLDHVFKTYFIVIKNRMQKVENLEEDKVLFKAIEEKKTRINTEQKAFANFVSTKSNAKSQKDEIKEKIKFVGWSKNKKRG